MDQLLPVPSLSSSAAILSSTAPSTLPFSMDWTDSNLDFDVSAASIGRDLNEKLNQKGGIIQLAPELKYQIGNLLDYSSLCMLRATIRDFRYFWSEEDIHRNFLSPFRSIDKMSSMMEKSVRIAKVGPSGPIRQIRIQQTGDMYLQSPTLQDTSPRSDCKIQVGIRIVQFSGVRKVSCIRIPR